MSTYLEVMDAVGKYYGGATDEWYKIAEWLFKGRTSVTEAEIAEMMNSVPEIEVTLSNSGKILGWDYKNQFQSIMNEAGKINSNLQNPAYGSAGSFEAKLNGTVLTETGTQVKTMSTGARTVSTGTKVATVAGKVNTAVTAVAAGMFLGAKIDSALYNAGKFFNLHPPEELNPQTWDNIASTEAGKQVLRFLFGIDDDEVTAYLSEDALEYMYNYWYNQGGWASGGMQATITPSSTILYNVDIPQPIKLSLPTGMTCVISGGNYQQGLYSIENLSLPSSALAIRIYDTSANRKPLFYIIAKSSFSASDYKIVYPNGTKYNGNRSSSTRSKNNTTIYYAQIFNYEKEVIADGTPAINEAFFESSGLQDAAYIALYGNVETVTGLDGFSRDPDAVDQVYPDQIDTSQPILPQLKTMLPNAFSNPIQEDVLQPDGTTKTITYYPVPWPSITTDTETPVTGTKTQTDPTVTSTDTADLTQPLVDVITYPYPQPSTPTPGGPATAPDTGDGDSPSTVIPDGSASSLWAVYNPTQAQLDAFGSWLWSSNFVDQLKKLFSNPMEAIIGVHKVFATPATGAAQNIKCGYIDSGVSSAVVTNQYTDIDCGSVDLREYFGNVFDYSPFTEISLYLPFIGIVPLDVSDVMRSTISVKYHVDVITGACLADVYVERDMAGGVLYQYSGSAIVSYPVSSGSYASAVAGVISIGAGIAGTIATGGALAPALVGGAVGLTKLHSNVQKSGGFSGAPGAMGCKIPYIIISRPQTHLPDDFTWFEGKPSNNTVALGDVSGYIRVKETHLENIPATGDELAEIEMLLKSGVIL